jgi:hypothetical protein
VGNIFMILWASGCLALHLETGKRSAPLRLSIMCGDWLSCACAASRLLSAAFASTKQSTPATQSCHLSRVQGVPGSLSTASPAWRLLFTTRRLGWQRCRRRLWCQRRCQRRAVPDSGQDEARCQLWLPLCLLPLLMQQPLPRYRAPRLLCPQQHYPLRQRTRGCCHRGLSPPLTLSERASGMLTIRALCSEQRGSYMHVFRSVHARTCYCSLLITSSAELPYLVPQLAGPPARVFQDITPSAMSQLVGCCIAEVLSTSHLNPWAALQHEAH